MKQCFILLLTCVYVFLLCSCSSKTELKQNTIQNQTLKDEISERKQAVQWVEPLESEELYDNRLEKASLSFLALDTTIGLYPFLDNFGSLDISSLSTKQRAIVESFCQSLSSEKKDTPFMAEQYDYFYYFVRSDILSLFGGAPHFWIFGKPFTIDGVTRVPIRFYKKAHIDECYCDCMVYLDGLDFERIVHMYVYNKNE